MVPNSPTLLLRRATPTTLERMAAQVEHWETAGDRRAVFLRCYALMTESMHEALRSERFHDAAWVEGLVEHFATYYFDALLAYEAGQSLVPPAWRYAHDMARARYTTVEEDLLLGINAHINADLPFAIRDVLLKERAALSPAQLLLRRQDFDTVNDVLSDTTAAVQQQVIDRYDPLMSVADHLLPQLVKGGEWVIERVLFAWRGEVWRQGMALLQARRGPEIRRLAGDVHMAAMRRVHVISFELDTRSHLLELTGAELNLLYRTLEKPWLRGL